MVLVPGVGVAGMFWMLHVVADALRHRELAAHARLGHKVMQQAPMNSQLLSSVLVCSADASLTSICTHARLRLAVPDCGHTAPTAPQEKKDSLEQQVQQQAAAAAEGAGAAISEEAWRAKYEALRAALPDYKRMKRTLAELESEAYVVGRTLEVLGEQEVAAQAAMENLEQQQGVQVGGTREAAVSVLDCRGTDGTACNAYGNKQLQLSICCFAA